MVTRFWRWSEGGFVPFVPPPPLLRTAREHPALASSDRLLLLPPLWDHHGHCLALGASLEEADLRGVPSLEEALGRVRAAAASMPEGAWLTGFGWDQNLWGGAFPPAGVLDEAAGERPVYLRRIDGHAAWASLEALSRAGLDEKSADPPGGRLLREGRRLTGVLVDAAMAAVERVLPAPDDAARRRRAVAGLSLLRGYGLQGATDMGLTAADLGALRPLDAEGALPRPLDAFLWEDPRGWREEWRAAGRSLRVLGAKVYADGALGSRGAALREDYSDDPGNRGLLLHAGGELDAIFAAARRQGLSLAVHAIGDAAVEAVLDALERQPAGLPLRVEHAQVLPEELVARLARSGAAASVQPCHWLSDRAWAPARLGPRAAWGYRLGTLAAAGVSLLLGSDFPIESPDPRRGLCAGLLREPAERLSFGALLRAFAPPPGRVPEGAATLAGEAQPSDLEEPERLLNWRLVAVDAAGAVP